MNKPIIAIKKSPRDYSGLVNLGNNVAVKLAGSAVFTTPVPTLIQLQAAVTDVSAAITKWGEIHNRGSHDDLVDLRFKALTLHQMLKAMAQYVQNTAQLAAGSDYAQMEAIINTTGFELRNANNRQGTLQMVQNFRQFITRKVERNQVRIKWKKPLNTQSVGNVKAYKVMRGTTNVLSAAAEIAAVTKTSYIDSNLTGAVQSWYYFIIPVNSAGNGIATDGLALTVLTV